MYCTIIIIVYFLLFNHNVGTILSKLGTLSIYKAAKQSVLTIPKSQTCMKLSQDLCIRQIRKKLCIKSVFNI